MVDGRKLKDHLLKLNETLKQNETKKINNKIKQDCHSTLYAEALTYGHSILSFALILFLI